LTDKSLQSSFGDYKWKFIDSVNGASVNDNDDDIRHIQDEDVSRKKKLSGNLEDTKAKKGSVCLIMFLFSFRSVCYDNDSLKR
jgi:hypothetical protein